MLAAKLILGLILIAVAGLGIADFVSNLNISGWFGLLITLFVFSTSIYKLMKTERFKTVYLCAAIVVAFAILCFGYLYQNHLSAGIWGFYASIYGGENFSVLNSLTFYFWAGFLLFTTAELFRKSDTRLSIYWKIYAVLALVNIVSVIGFAISTSSGK